MEDKIRLVVMQLKCHPALNRGPLALLEEPFLPDSEKCSLGYLSGLGIPTSNLQEVFREEYLTWHSARLKSLLSHPLLKDECSTLIVFPEGSIPANILPMLYDFSIAQNVSILAGTHTILDTIDAKDIYRSLGKNELCRRQDISKDVMFIFVNDKIYQALLTF